MLITVIVESLYTGAASGFTQIVVDDNEPVRTIIKKFCDTKGAPVDPLYAIINDANVSFDSEKSIAEYRVQDNDHLKLGRRREPAYMFKYVNWYRVSVLSTVAGLIGIAGLCACYALLRQIPQKYGVIFDAGSTHTDAIVYQWPGERLHGTGQLSQLGNCSVEKKGIADVPVMNVSSYLTKCINSAKGSIPKDRLFDTEVFFGATAGMRILLEKNETTVAEILTQVRSSLKQSDFVYEDSNVDVISGSREGLSGWISVNFLNQTLQNGNLQSTGSEKPTLGALDLGGASLQISFEVDNSTENELIHPITLYGRNYNVYTQSFLCYGIVQAFNRYRALLIMSRNDSSNYNISSPCEPIGYSYKKKSSAIFGGPCVGNLSMAIGGKNDFTFFGTNDEEACSSHVKELVHSDFCKRVNSSHCLNVSTYPQDITKRYFMAFSAFGHVINDLNMSSRVSKKDFKTKINWMCSTNYDHLVFIQNSFKLQLSLRTLEGLCFGGNYIDAVLTEAFNFSSPDDWKRLDFRTEVSGVGVSWSLGYMMNETVYMSPTPSVPEMEAFSFGILLCVFILLVIFGLVFFFQAAKLDRPTTYERNSMSLQPREIA